MIHVFAMRRAEVACWSPVAYYYSGMVNGVVLSLMYLEQRAGHTRFRMMWALQ